jgi:hypothetical protein
MVQSDKGHLGEDSRVNDMLSAEAVTTFIVVVGLE